MPSARHLAPGRDSTDDKWLTLPGEAQINGVRYFCPNANNLSRVDVACSTLVKENLWKVTFNMLIFRQSGHGCIGAISDIKY